MKTFNQILEKHGIFGYEEISKAILTEYYGSIYFLFLKLSIISSINSVNSFGPTNLNHIPPAYAA